MTRRVAPEPPGSHQNSRKCAESKSWRVVAWSEGIRWGPSGNNRCYFGAIVPGHSYSPVCIRVQVPTMTASRLDQSRDGGGHCDLARSGLEAAPGEEIRNTVRQVMIKRARRVPLESPAICTALPVSIRLHKRDLKPAFSFSWHLPLPSFFSPCPACVRSARSYCQFNHIHTTHHG